MFLNKYLSTWRKLSIAKELSTLIKVSNDCVMLSIFKGNEILIKFRSSLKLTSHEVIIFCYLLSFGSTILENIFS